MALTPKLKNLTCRLAKSAEFARSATMRDLERSQLLELSPGAKLLDAGAGSGWPGLYLAQLAGCDIVLVDVPVAALRIARERATDDGLSRRCEAVVADEHVERRQALIGAVRAGLLRRELYVACAEADST